MDSPLASALPLDTTGYHSSSISEVDSLSDSDWLDLASNRESDDNDSVCSRESYRDSDVDRYRGRSRRSSTSDLSSRDGDVEAWEGLVEDSTDEEASGAHLASTISPVFPRIADRETRLDASGNLTIRQDVSEEDRVNAALDQSMIGTLSSSRSSSLGNSRTSAVHSTRDLRLSFPDPLTSSRDELDTFDEVSSPSDATFSATEGEDPLPSSSIRTSPLDVNATPPRSIARVPLHIPVNITPTTPDFDIVLYGQSSDTKWSVVRKLLQKMDKLQCDEESSLSSSAWRVIDPRHKHFHGITGSTSFPNGIDVIDKTTSTSTSSLAINDTNVCYHFFIFWKLTSQHSQRSSKDQGARPSLAVIFLPTSQCLTVDHSFYLPVLLSSDPVTREAAMADWKDLDIPTGLIFPHKADYQHDPFLEGNNIDKLSTVDVHKAFQVLKAVPQRKSTKAITERVNVRHATVYVSVPLHLVVAQLTINVYSLALLTIMIGVAMNVTTRSSSTVPAPTPTLENRISWALWNPTPNRSAVVSPSTADAVNTAIVPSSLKDFALAVFSPNTPSPITSQTSGCSSTGASPRCECKMMTWSERFQSSKDIILRDVPSSLSLDAGSKAARSKARSAHSKAISLLAPAHKRAGALSSSLSLKLVDSLSEIFDIKALTQVFENDMKEIMEAIDKLMQVIGRQTSIIMAQSKRTTQTLRDRFQYRHMRAQVRARQLKKMGDHLVAVAAENFLSRANIAKEKARALKDTLITSEHWVAHRKRMEAKAERNKKDRKSRRLKRRAVKSH
jgi:hypothetical protein